MVGVGPDQDLFATQLGQRLQVADVPLFGEKLSQGRPAGQAAEAQAQAAVYFPPVLREDADDKAGFRHGPGAGTSMVGVGPLQNFGYGEHMPIGLRFRVCT